MRTKRCKLNETRQKLGKNLNSPEVLCISIDFLKTRCNSIKILKTIYTGIFGSHNHN